MNSDKLRRYKELRTQVVDFISEADAALAENAKTRGNPKGLELEEFKKKVADDRFEMVLIGAFQSGKSTFFNYLCDGRELSPIGFGIRTSGCKVSAHYVESDRDEKAVLSWRSPAELLKSLGSTLVPELAREDAKGSTCLTENEVNLAKRADRQRLAQAAWKRLAAHVDDDSQELVRLALLVSEFYPEYEQRCKQGSTEMSFEEATNMASYPSNWSPLWLEAMQSHDLSCFKARDVAFAFVGAMDVYVNSPMLKELGCSVTDSPGLFISEWDTAIAQKCMRQADAVLFTFAGQKAMNAEEKRVLKQCISTGVQDKLILGANLQIQESQWQCILHDSVEPDLVQVGFESPSVIPYHAALALRSREYMALSRFGALSSETQKAIDAKISLIDGQAVPSDEQRKKYLEKRINQYLGTLSDFEEDWQTYADMDESERYDKLDERSHAPHFIAAANSIMAPRKSRSVLIEQGVKPALRMLEQMTAESRDRKAFLNQDIETKRRKLQEQREAFKEFEESRTNAVNNVQNSFDRNISKIGDHFRKCAADKFDARNNDIVNQIHDKLPNIFQALLYKIFGNRVAMCQEFMNSISPIFNEILNELRSEVADSFTKLEEFSDMRHKYEFERKHLMKQASALENIGSLQDMEITLDADYGAAASQMVIAGVKEIFETLLDDQTSIWNLIWNILTFGGWQLFNNRHAQAQAMLNNKRTNFHQMLGNAIVNALNSDKAPFQILRGKIQEFSAAFEQPVQSFRKIEEEKKKDLENAEGNKKLIETLGYQVERAEELRKRGITLRENCEAFCRETC